jgi:hypothetical protein
MYGGHVYVIAHGPGHFNLKLWNRESLPYTSHANTEITSPQVESHDIFSDEKHKQISLFPCVPVYGIHAISHGCNGGGGLPTTFRFWLASPTTDINHPLSFSTSSLIVELDGRVMSRDATLLCAGSSGKYILALVDGGEDEHELRLIHYGNQVEDPSSRVLTLPQFLSYQLDDVCSIGLDDHLGKVYLVMFGGALCELSYV